MAEGKPGVPMQWTYSKRNLETLTILYETSALYPNNHSVFINLISLFKQAPSIGGTDSPAPISSLPEWVIVLIVVLVLVVVVVVLVLVVVILLVRRKPGPKKPR